MSELNYVDYDFDELVIQLQNKVKEHDAWKDVYRSSTGQMMIELFAGVANLFLFYVERRAEETYLDTAKNKSSVINLVRLINYLPKRKTSAQGSLTFSLESANTKIVYIPQWTECQTSGGTKYVTVIDVALVVGQTSVSVTAIQGEHISVDRTSDGTADQEYNISDTAIENNDHTDFDTFSVIINEGTGFETWEQVTSFLDSDSTSKHYRFRQEKNDTVTILFGDDIQGKAPATNSTIRISYVRTTGLDGNIYSSDQITTLNDTIYDEDGDAVSGVSVTNSDVLLGGDDEEDIDEIKKEAPQVFATGDRAVTRTDFNALLMNYAGVATANAWGENEEGSPDYDMFNKVNICLLLQNWAHPSTAIKALISTYLYTYSMVTVKYEFITAVILDVIIVIDITVVKGYSLSQTQTDVETALEADFVLGDTTDLGEDKQYSNLIRIADALSSVAWHHMVLEIRKVLTSSYESGYEFGTTLDATSILTESVRVFVGDDEVGIDDGSGGFTATGSTYTLDGTINYTTGVVLINFNPDVSAGTTVYVRYQQDSSGDIVTSELQVCRLYDIDVTSIALED